MRRFFAKIHLWLAIPLGVVIMIMSLSGAILLFEKEILEFTYRDNYVADEQATRPIVLDQLITIAQSKLSPQDSIGAIKINSDPKMNYQFIVIDTQTKKSRCIYINPYNAALEGSSEVRNHFFLTMRSLHRWLLDDFDREVIFPVGKRITGISTIVFVILLMTGLILWFPKNKKMLPKRFRINFHQGWRRFFYDLHVVGGFYLVPILLVLTLTGLSWSFNWYRTGFYRLLGADPTAVFVSQSISETTASDSVNYHTWAIVFYKLKTTYQHFSNLTIQDGNVSVSLSDCGNIKSLDRYLFNRETGAIESSMLYKDQTRMNQLRGWVYSVHVGAWGGGWTKIISFIAALMGIILPITGYYFWIKKYWGCKK